MGQPANLMTNKRSQKAIQKSNPTPSDTILAQLMQKGPSANSSIAGKLLNNPLNGPLAMKDGLRSNTNQFLGRQNFPISGGKVNFKTSAMKQGDSIFGRVQPGSSKRQKISITEEKELDYTDEETNLKLIDN